MSVGSFERRMQRLKLGSAYQSGAEPQSTNFNTHVRLILDPRRYSAVSALSDAPPSQPVCLIQ